MHFNANNALKINNANSIWLTVKYQGWGMKPSTSNRPNTSNRPQLSSWTCILENAWYNPLLFSNILQEVAPGDTADVLLAQLIHMHFLALGSLNNAHYKNNGQIEDIYW